MCHINRGNVAINNSVTSTDMRLLPEHKPRWKVVQYVPLGHAVHGAPNVYICCRSSGAGP